MFAFLVMTLLFTSCQRIEGEGPIIQQNIDISNFTSVNLAGSFDVEVLLGSSFSIVAEGQENIIERLQTDVSTDGTLELKLDLGNYYNYQLKVYVTMPTAKTLSVSGSGNMVVDVDEALVLDNLDLQILGSGDMSGRTEFEINHQLKAQISGSGDMDFDLYAGSFDGKISGSGNINFNMETNDLDIDLSGSGIATIHGSAPQQKINISGSGDFNGFEAYGEAAEVNISGSGNARVQLNQSLDARISGSGNIWYKGSPTVSSDITGSGAIRNAN